MHVLDASEPLTDADKKFLAEFENKKKIFVLNKIDLPQKLELPPELAAHHSSRITVSCTNGDGIEQLKDAIKNLVWSGAVNAGNLQVTINSRHQDALNRARTAAQTAREALAAGSALEFVAFDLRIAANAVGEVVGRTTTEDLLDIVFSTFCIGK